MMRDVDGWLRRLAVIVAVADGFCASRRRGVRLGLWTYAAVPLRLALHGIAARRGWRSAPPAVFFRRDGAMDRGPACGVGVGGDGYLRTRPAARKVGAADQHITTIREPPIQATAPRWPQVASSSASLSGHPSAPSTACSPAAAVSARCDALGLRSMTALDVRIGLAAALGDLRHRRACGRFELRGFSVSV